MLPQSLLRRVGRRSLLAGAAATVLLLGAVSAHAQDTLKIGLVTALSGQSATSGEAITRGLSIAIDEINAKGGLLGRKLELVRRDDESNPAKGVIAARELVFKEKVAVLFGGLDTPVSMAIVPFANSKKVPFMGPWAAGTPITQNGANPQLRVPRLRGRRDRRQGDAPVRAEDLQRQEARHDPGQQSLGRIEREGPQGRAGRQGHDARRHREVRGQRRRRGAAADAPEGSGRRRAVPGRQRRRRPRRS